MFDAIYAYVYRNLYRWEVNCFFFGLTALFLLGCGALILYLARLIWDEYRRASRG